MIRSLAERVILAEGWRRALIATATGAAGALAMPPFGAWPALAVSLTVAVWLLDGSEGGRRFRRAATLRRAALAGWFWGFGYFVAGLWWLGSAFLVDADTFAWLMPFGVLGLPAYLALYPALGFTIARLLWSRGPLRLFALAVGLGLGEWLRGYCFTGFPWNALGLSFGQNIWLMQTASLVGMTGLTFLAIPVLASPATLGTGETRTGRLLPAACAALTLVAMAIFGAWRASVPPVADVAGVNLRLVQPNVAQDDKFRPSNGPEILEHYLSLSERSPEAGGSGLSGVTHLIWPESAFPFLLHREPNALARIAASLSPGTVLITGAARRGEALPGEEAGRFYNSIQAVAPDGAITATYDKVHLVPFGEYVPSILERLLRGIGLRQFVHIPGGFTPGERHAVLRVPGLPPVAATVCYEAIFPDEVVPDGPRPGVILNLTNDGWFGDTPGPRQHFAQARLRAVEQGLPLVRVANSGISAIVDPYGRTIAALQVGQEGVLDGKLPSRVDPTLFSRLGELVGVMMCTVYAFAALAGTLSGRTSSGGRTPALRKKLR